MQVSVEKTSNLGRRLTIEVPAQLVEREADLRLKDLSKNMRIDGFRAGKVPPKVIKERHGDQIRYEAINKVLESSLGTALKDNNMRPANTPNVEDLDDAPGKNLTFKVSFEIYPEITLKDFSTIELEKEVADITEEDLDSGVQKLQDQFATWAKVSDRAVQNGDLVTIDFVGMLNGEPFANGSSENFDLEIGSGRFIPGFEEGLIGLVEGEDKTIDLTFPAEYGAAELAGKAVQFNVNLKKIQAKALAAVDEAFAARIGIEDKDVSKVRSTIRENMIKYLGEVTQTKLRDQALQKLLEVNNFDLPDTLIGQEKHNLIHEKLQKAAHDHDHDLTPEQDIEFTAEAKKRVAMGLLLNEIITKHNLQPEESRVLAKLRSMALMYGGQADFIKKMYSESKELRQNINNMVLTDQAADLIVANATIKEKQSTFYGIVNAKTETE